MYTKVYITLHRCISLIFFRKHHCTTTSPKSIRNRPCNSLQRQKTPPVRTNSALFYIFANPLPRCRSTHYLYTYPQTLLTTVRHCTVLLVFLQPSFLSTKTPTPIWSLISHSIFFFSLSSFAALQIYHRHVTKLCSIYFWLSS